MQPMTERGIDELSKAIQEAVKDDIEKDEQYYQFDRKPRHDEMGKDAANLNKRKQEIFSCEENKDNFLLKQFKQHGIKNLFDKPVLQFTS